MSSNRRARALRRKRIRSKRKGNRFKKPWSTKKKVIVIIASVISLIILLALGYVAWVFSNLADQVKVNKANLNINSDISHEKGYLNIALIGVDSRQVNKYDDEDARADTMIIASLNQETKEIKLVSVYRDTVLRMPGSGELNKANAAYSLDGGYEGTLSLLNENLDMDISNFVAVDFKALADLVDAVGGVEIDVKQREIWALNGLATEVSKVTGKKKISVMHAGKQTLNGVQATAYARIRKIDTDYKRTERQRIVLEAVMKKAQHGGFRTVNKIVSKIFPEIITSFSKGDIIKYGKDVTRYKLVETAGFPFEKTDGTVSGLGSVVAPVNLTKNVIELHKYLFNKDDFTPSSTVTEISNAVYERTMSIQPADQDASITDTSKTNTVGSDGTTIDANGD
ncbi:MAG: LCP family protein [Lachnospiraceae bacterium]|jgi:LCP family protein required for cell wall assembly|nr:LCP family protein [Lachnospiraceae bacterium]